MARGKYRRQRVILRVGRSDLGCEAEVCSLGVARHGHKRGVRTTEEGADIRSSEGQRVEPLLLQTL